MICFRIGKQMVGKVAPDKSRPAGNEKAIAEIGARLQLSHCQLSHNPELATIAQQTRCSTRREDPFFVIVRYIGW
jgi:hypothetical protein